MNLKKHRENRAARRLHQQGMSAAGHIVSRHALLDKATNSTPAEVVALLFGWTGDRITEDDAHDYLNAVLADRGYPLLAASTEAGGGQ
ncbi:hypothetical protein [Streptomyces sp. NBC_01092]|uniref:hypothetical protein n=1 Tax=Streptomyces sp. NBC_01092 TaxID=2903748 RepID=UPI00386573CA|nr:hypothetical protein OG254_24155 [Streptomyces sp. NBC_01092]